MDIVSKISDALGAITSMASGAASKLTKLAGKLLFFGSVITIFFTSTGLFAALFLTLLGVLHEAEPKLSPYVLYGLSFMPYYTTLVCMGAVFSFKVAILVYTVKTPFLILGASIPKRSIGFLN